MSYPPLSCEDEPTKALEYISLAVRMKLDLAGRKLSLRDWQAIPLEQRRELHNFEADNHKAIKRFRHKLEDALRQAHRPSPRRLSASGSAYLREWKHADQLPDRIGDLNEAQTLRRDWPRFDRFARYVLWHLATKGDVLSFRTTLQELYATSVIQLDQHNSEIA